MLAETQGEGVTLLGQHPPLEACLTISKFYPVAELCGQSGKGGIDPFLDYDLQPLLGGPTQSLLGGKGLVGTSALPHGADLRFGGALPRYGRGERGHSDLQGTAADAFSPEPKLRSHGTMWGERHGCRASESVCSQRATAHVLLSSPGCVPATRRGQIFPGDVCFSLTSSFSPPKRHNYRQYFSPIAPTFVMSSSFWVEAMLNTVSSVNEQSPSQQIYFGRNTDFLKPRGLVCMTPTPRN